MTWVSYYMVTSTVARETQKLWPISDITSLNQLNVDSFCQEQEQVKVKLQFVWLIENIIAVEAYLSSCVIHASSVTRRMTRSIRRQWPIFTRT